MLKFKNISIGIQNKDLFSIQELELETGLYAIVGRNGTGKSTFINTILDRIPVKSGEIEIKGKSLDGISAKEMARLMAVVYTKPDVFGNHTVKEVLKLGRIPYQGMLSKTSAEDEQTIDYTIDLLNLNEFIDREFNTLSDGEKQLVMIGRALIQDTDIILLDEPGAFLDLVNRYELIELLSRITKETGKLVLFSTHHIDILEKYCDGVLLINENEMRLMKDRNSYLTTIQKAFGIED